MSQYQLHRLKELAAQSQCNYVWVDWTCVPQIARETMRFVNASYEIYNFAETVVFIPRIKELKRRGWPRLSPQAATEAIEIARASAERVLSSGSFTDGFKQIFLDTGPVERAESQLRGSKLTSNELRRQVESAMNILLRLLAGEDVQYPTFDYYTRAWTLAERMVRFKPSQSSLIRLCEMNSAGEAMLYSMSAFWRPAEVEHDASRKTLTESDLKFAVYLRGVDENDEDVRELWVDMNRIVQVVPGFVGVATEIPALAVICIELLLQENIGARDRTGHLAARLLGECAAFTATAITGATLQEEANREWFRKYLHFQAGSVYGSTIPDDLILAVYRSCGLPERETAREAIEFCLAEVFGPATEARREAAAPGIDRLCREALMHKELHTHMPSTGSGERGLVASDFAPMLASFETEDIIDLSTWHEWLSRSGILTCWRYSNPDGTDPGEASDHIDVEHLYCGEVANVAGLSLDEFLAAAVSVVYTLHRLSNHQWQIVQISLSRRAGRAGEGLSAYRVKHKLKLDSFVGPQIVRNGRVSEDLIDAWNKRCLASLDEDLHYYWGQCVFATNIQVVS